MDITAITNRFFDADVSTFANILPDSPSHVLAVVLGIDTQSKSNALQAVKSDPAVLEAHVSMETYHDSQEHTTEIESNNDANLFPASEEKNITKRRPLLDKGKEPHNDRFCASYIQRLPATFTGSSVYLVEGLPTPHLPVHVRHLELFYTFGDRFENVKLKQLLTQSYPSFEEVLVAHKTALKSLTNEQFGLLLTLAEYLRYQRRIKQKYLECAFCKNNGENEECYSSHALKDWRGRVLCPVLRAFRCPRCGATGDRAHTIKYCPKKSIDDLYFLK